MTRDDTYIFEGALSFIRGQPAYFQQDVCAMVESLLTDKKTYNKHIINHYAQLCDEEGLEKEISNFREALTKIPPARENMILDPLVQSLQKAEKSTHTRPSEIVDAIVMKCYERFNFLHSGETTLADIAPRYFDSLPVLQPKLTHNGWRVKL